MNEKEKLKQSLKDCEYCSVPENKLDNIDENYIEIMSAMLETNKQLIEENKFSKEQNSLSDEKQNILDLIDNSNIETETAYSILEQNVGQREEQKQELLDKIESNGLDKNEFKDVSVEELEKVVENFDTSSNFKGKHSKKEYDKNGEKRRKNKKSYSDHVNDKEDK